MNKIHEHHFGAMGCQIKVWVGCPDLSLAQQKLADIEALFHVEEQRLSRFLPTSELSILNAHAGEWFAVSKPLWRLVKRAIVLAKETNGLFDPTILEALERAGYRDSFQKMRQALPEMERAGLAETAVSARQNHHAYEWIGLDTVDRAILLPKGVRLDLGGIGKGATAQTAVSAICQSMPCLIDAGGDLTAGAPPPNWPGWPVGVQAPWSNDELFRLWLTNGSLATSGVDYRHWRQGGRQMHHLIDPRTHEPAKTDLITASVLGKDGCRAEAWATALMVAGKASALHLLEQNELDGCLIDETYQLDLMPAFAHQVQWELGI